MDTDDDDEHVAKTGTRPAFRTAIFADDAEPAADCIRWTARPGQVELTFVEADEIGRNPLRLVIAATAEDALAEGIRTRVLTAACG